MLKPILATAAALVLAGCTVSVPAGKATLGPAPAVAGGTYTSPGGISVALEAREIGGRTGACGVWAESVRQSVMTRGAGQQVLSRGAVVLGSEAIVQDLTWLRQVEPAESYAGMEGNCVVTERPWQAADVGKPVRIALSRQMVYNDGGDLGESGGFQIWFRPGGPGAHPSDKKPWYHDFPNNLK